MDAWAASYGSKVAFVCVSCDGPNLAGQFGNELKLRHCFNTWCDEDDMPSWGQLGCNGLIVIDGADNVVSKASPAFLEVKQAAFRYVEKLLTALIDSKPVPEASSGRVDSSIGGACATVRFGGDVDLQQVIVAGLSSRPELNGKRGRVLAEEANGRVSVQIDGEKAPLSIKRQNVTPLAEGVESSAVGVAASGNIHVPSVKVAVLDAEHDDCVEKLKLLGKLTQPSDAHLKPYEEHLRREQVDETLRGLLREYEEHFGHEEALLDMHLYAGVAQHTGFSADKGARTSHFGDHQSMLSAVRKLLANSLSVSAADVLQLAADFERHATEYDGGYADRLSAAMAQTVA